MVYNENLIVKTYSINFFPAFILNSSVYQLNYILQEHTRFYL